MTAIDFPCPDCGPLALADSFEDLQVEAAEEGEAQMRDTLIAMAAVAIIVASCAVYLVAVRIDAALQSGAFLAGVLGK